MSQSIRPRLISGVFFSSLATAALIATSPDQLRMSAASNVTLRQAPNSTSASVAPLPLGTEVTEAGPPGMDKTWIHVKTTDGKDGWVLASLTKPVDSANPWPVRERAIVDRLNRKGDSFAANVELCDFVERVATDAHDSDLSARFDLYRLRAISATLKAIPARADKREPYASWIAKHKDVLVYDQPGRVWMLSNAAIWTSHKAHADSPSADEIAWLAVTTGLPGECEGQVTCYLEGQNRLNGEYLRQHPTGRHAADAIAVLKQTTDLMNTPPAPPFTYSFDASKECNVFTTTVSSLRLAIATSTAAGRDGALQSIDTLRGRCR
jgi:hypothetical protein